MGGKRKAEKIHFLLILLRPAILSIFSRSKISSCRGTGGSECGGTVYEQRIINGGVKLRAIDFQEHKLSVHSFPLNSSGWLSRTGQAGSDWVWLGQAGPGWVRLGKDRPGWVMLRQAGSDWVWLGQAEAGWLRLGQAGSGWARLGQAGPGWVRLGQAGSGWVRLGQSETGSARLG